MGSSLIGLHAAFGEIGSILFLWIFIELLNPSEKSLKRSRKAALAGFLFLILTWIIGGYYYIKTYGTIVKPLIK